VTDVCLTLFVPRSLEAIEDGLALLALLRERSPALMPEKYGNYEPLREVARGRSDREVLECWRYPFLWMRRKPRVDGSVWMTKGLSVRAQHSSIKVHCRTFALEEELCDFLRAAAVVFNADLGFVHALTDEDVKLGLMADVIGSPTRSGNWYLRVSSHRLKRYLPDMYWGVVFGPPYVQMFGRERLLGSPASVVDELDSGHVYLQASRSLADLVEGTSEVRAVRDRVKRHLGSEAFFSPDLGAEGEYRVPEFRFGERVDSSV
jgi:hypothetical protein